MNGYHIIAYDLTTAQDGGSEAFANPSVRVGNTISLNIIKIYTVTFHWSTRLSICTRSIYEIAYMRSSIWDQVPEIEYMRSSIWDRVYKISIWDQAYEIGYMRSGIWDRVYEIAYMRSGI